MTINQPNYSMENQTIQRCPHDTENPYAQISRNLIRDVSISPECRLLIIYLLSMSDNWSINMKQLISHFKPHMGRDKVYNLVNQAIEAGYMKKVIDKKGNLNRSIRYFVSESPKFKENPRLPEIQDPETRDPENKHYKKEHSPKKEHIGKKQQQAPTGAKVCDAVVVFYKCIEDLGLTEKEKKSLMKYPEEEVKEAVRFAIHPKTKIKTTIIQTLMWALRDKPKMPTPADIKKNRKRAESGASVLESKGWNFEAKEKYALVESTNPYNPTTYAIPYEWEDFEVKLNEVLEKCKFKLMEKSKK